MNCLSVGKYGRSERKRAFQLHPHEIRLSGTARCRGTRVQLVDPPGADDGHHDATIPTSENHQIIGIPR
jgi:hypothetical protein